MDFFSNLADRGITVCHGCNETQVLSKRIMSDLGYCFYRPEEKAYAEKTGILFLSWGAYATVDIEMELLKVVNAILDEANACSLECSWNGTMKDRIVLKKLDTDFFADQM